LPKLVTTLPEAKALARHAHNVARAGDPVGAVLVSLVDEDNADDSINSEML
jgi:hypothetical protein